MTPRGCLDATSDADKIAEWWTKTPNANIGLSTDGLFIVDVDPLKDGSKNTFADDTDRLADLLDAGYGTFTPRGGQHFWFQQTENQDLRNTAGRIAEGVDTRGNGGYVLVPPSETENGQYRWIPGFELEVPGERLPLVPLWILDALADRRPVIVMDDGTSPIPDGQRNSTLASIGGTLRRHGLSQKAIESALRATNFERCKPPLDDEEVAKIAWSVAKYDADQAATAVAEGWAAELDAEKPHKKIHDPGRLPEWLLNPGGFMGEIIDWSVKTAYKPQPELSLAATVCLLATLTGRKICNSRGMRTNVYCMGLCPSGGGKEHTRKVNKTLLQAAGLERFIGPEGIGSHAGILSHLKQEAVQLFQVDEFGRFMMTVNSPGKSPHLYNVVGVFLKLFTSADSLFIGDAVSDTKRVPQIDQPHAVLYATTVAQSFLESLSKESLSDGFVSRLLVFEASETDPEAQDMDQEAPPAELVEQVRWWGDYKPGGNLSLMTPQPRRLATNAEAKAVFRELDIQSRANSKSDRETASLWTRTVEKAHKLAMLHAVSLDRESEEITEASAKWGCELSRHLTQRMEWLATDWVSENSQEETLKRVLRVIRSAGDTGISLARIYRATQWLGSRARDEALNALWISGQVEKKQVNTGGRPATVYSAKDGV